MGNAPDYADAEVQIHVTDDGATCSTHCADDGPGIPVDERERCLRDLKRGSQSVPGGTGLGGAGPGMQIASGGDVQIVDSPVGACSRSAGHRWPTPTNPNTRCSFLTEGNNQERAPSVLETALMRSAATTGGYNDQIMSRSFREFEWVADWLAVVT